MEKEPNKETLKALKESKNPENLESYKSTEELFEALGINTNNQ